MLFSLFMYRKFLKTANSEKFTQFEKQYYAPSIKEANAWGFTSPINAKINRDFYNSVEEAHYKLRKYISLEDLKRSENDAREKEKAREKTIIGTLYLDQDGCL